MPEHTGNDHAANLDFIGERISSLVKTALADEPERNVYRVRRALEGEIEVHSETGQKFKVEGFLAEMVKQVTDLEWATDLDTDNAVSGLPLPPEISEDEDLTHERPVYDEQAARAYRSTPSPDIEFNELLSSDQMAERLGVSRPTVHTRLKQGTLIGWQSQSNRIVFPAGQLDDFNRPAPELAQVIDAFVDPQVAWLWLSRPSDLLRGDIPIERLKAAWSAPEKAQAVIDAAMAKSLGAFS